jgi:hypothetical protein
MFFKTYVTLAKTSEGDKKCILVFLVTADDFIRNIEPCRPMSCILWLTNKKLLQVYKHNNYLPQTYTMDSICLIFLSTFGISLYTMQLMHPVHFYTKKEGHIL